MRTKVNPLQFKIISKDESGAFVDIDFTCPKCHCDSGDIIFIGAKGVSFLESEFEIDLLCPICKEKLTTVCQ